MNQPTILLFGANGQLGHALQRDCEALGRVQTVTRDVVDLGDASALRDFIRAVRPDMIVNAAAYTAVDQAESQPELAHAINAIAPAIMAREAHRLGAWLLHYSTDYVFDGQHDAPYAETHVTHPLSVYGQSKRAGEIAIAASGARHLILRTSWVYGATGSNFLKTILRLARERRTLSVVADQIGAPTPASMISAVSALALHAARQQRLASGLYHLSASGSTSWHGYAREVVDSARTLGVALRLSADDIEAINTEQYPLPAARPRNSRLDCQRLTRALGLSLPDWRDGIETTLKEVLAS